MIDILTTIDNLKSNGIQMFAPISPNVNWHNQSNWIRTKQLFWPTFQQLHMSAVSSDIGLEPGFANKSLVGGSAILTFGLWASKVHSSSHDLSGYGSYSITTIQGKHNKEIRFISAYIAVPKGSNIGVESLYVQQITINVKRYLKSQSTKN